MAEIKISISDLESAVTKLNGYAASWAANNTTPPATVGGGSTVNELEKIAQLYKDLNSHMATLASSTATFFSNIKDSYQESDQKAASNISGG